MASCIDIPISFVWGSIRMVTLFYALKLVNEVSGMVRPVFVFSNSGTIANFDGPELDYLCIHALVLHSRLY